MKNILSQILLTLCLTSAAFSQISVKEDVTTDSVNLFANYEQSAKSSRLAMGLSAVLPGTGHQYLGRNNSALAYLAFDALALFGAIYTGTYSNKLNIDSRGYAALHANASADKEDNRYWTALESFDNVNSYNEAMRLNRDNKELYNDASRYWKWNSTDEQKEYKNIRKKASRYQLASSIFIGTMVLNRVVSIIDIRSSSRYKVLKSVSSVNFSPSLSPDLTSAGLVMNAQF